MAVFTQEELSESERKLTDRSDLVIREFDNQLNNLPTVMKDAGCSDKQIDSVMSWVKLEAIPRAMNADDPARLAAFRASTTTTENMKAKYGSEWSSNPELVAEAHQKYLTTLEIIKKTGSNPFM